MCETNSPDRSRYIQLVSSLKKWYNELPAGSKERERLESIHPEFKEKGDEDLRRSIANELCCLRAGEPAGSDRYVELGAMLNYLERQRARKVFVPNKFQLDALAFIIDHPDRMTEYNKNQLQTLLETLRSLRGGMTGEEEIQ